MLQTTDPSGLLVSDQALTCSLFLLLLRHQEAQGGSILTLTAYMRASRWTVSRSLASPAPDPLCSSPLSPLLVQNLSRIFRKPPHQLEWQTRNNVALFSALVFQTSMLELRSLFLPSQVAKQSLTNYSLIHPGPATISSFSFLGTQGHFFQHMGLCSSFVSILFCFVLFCFPCGTGGGLERMNEASTGALSHISSPCIALENFILSTRNLCLPPSLFATLPSKFVPARHAISGCARHENYVTVGSNQRVPGFGPAPAHSTHVLSPVCAKSSEI